uniref:ATP synthase F0 subunit 8 n=1 Tax=Ptychadena levenorum TaxID=2039361 RepID=UPI00286C1C2B|nr:ATP synthase F0 subunit 8 [Ptychadena levenorum]WKT10226.1 ATP synthase F0 subunit 8 [Ptychadena levenorum]WKT10239.1 ATP synthase F0 subunit 8 [Ptychadena levenorum]WKT10252.1 ATP synthase F0 subunit 8 [Ptychadena levenorum]WKT10265.1 ATP synthase F0 subunit 8 [Ptychadena levenorum]WKT10278.1 ATP synthase F0 subunit 8 [Ptychadena levenorum]
MPQLMSEPWFYIFVSSWVTLLFVSPNKILSHTFPNDFTLKTSKTGNSWWPWSWQ